MSIHVSVTHFCIRKLILICVNLLIENRSKILIQVKNTKEISRVLLIDISCIL